MTISGNHEYGKQIKKRLIDLNMTQDALICKVRADSGLYFDGSYLHKIMFGQRSAPRLVAAINKILEIEESPKGE